jgi:hypothetical protein
VVAALSKAEPLSLPKSLAEMIFALAGLDIGFKKCCLRSGLYDGENRTDYFRE